MKLTQFMLLLLPTLVFGTEALRKTAVLFLPEQIECKSGSGRVLPAEIGFRWDEAEPLNLKVWWNSETDKADRLLGDIDVFDENGRELSYQIFMSVPPLWSDEIVVRKGEQKRFKLFVSASNVVFPRPGHYYAIASFSFASSGERDVVFRTSKRWFRVIEASPRNEKPQ